jgi:phosphoglucomutase
MFRALSKLYERSLQITSFKSLEGTNDIDLNAHVGTQFALTPTSTVTIIDPFAEYIDALKSCFDFEALQKFGRRPNFSILYDGMHGAGGPFAKRVLIEELGLTEVSSCDRGESGSVGSYYSYASNLNCVEIFAEM